MASRSSTIIAATTLLLVPILTVTLLADPKIGVLACLCACTLLGLTFAVGRRPDALAVLLVMASAGQRGLSALTGDPNALLLDDLVLAVVGLYLLSRTRSIFSQNRLLAVSLAAVVLMLILGVFRTSDLTIGLYQLRQALQPILLLTFGFILGLENLAKLRPWVIGLGLIAAAYAVVEFFGVHPIDPTGYSSFQTIRVLELKRELPGFYYYWTPGQDYIVRSGSFLLSPPAAGIYIATAALWVWWRRYRLTATTAVITVVLILGVGLTIARSGFLILGLLILQPILTAKLGRWSFVVFGAAFGSLVAREFLTHGESIRHVEGALHGLKLAITHPFGDGFGQVGNVLKVARGFGVGESSLAIFLGCTGWIGLMAVGALLWRGIQEGRTIGGVALTAAILVAAFAESQLDGAVTLWILAGTALVGSSVAGARAESLPKPKHFGPPTAVKNQLGEIRV